MLVFVSLESAIFWGQYSRCTSSRRRSLLRSDGIDHSLSVELSTELMYHRELTYGVECNHTSAMKSVCTFSVMMFLSYLALIAVLIKFKNEILGSAPLNEGYSAVPTTPSESVVPPSLPHPVGPSSANPAAVYSSQ